jgi:hypothetical protein
MKSENLYTIKYSLFFTILVQLLIFPVISKAGDTPGSFYESRITLNPDCKIKRMSNGMVIVTTNNQEGLVVKHQFTDLYADLLMAVYRKQRVNMIINNISKKYYLSQDDCRREIKHAINVLIEWNIVLRNEQFALH